MLNSWRPPLTKWTTLSYQTFSQIWLINVVKDCQSPYLTKLKNKNPCFQLMMIDCWVHLTHHRLCGIQNFHIIVFTHGFCLTQIKLFTKTTTLRIRTLNLVSKLKVWSGNWGCKNKFVVTKYTTKSKLNSFYCEKLKLIEF
jgi:hypothetical protein